LNTYISRNKREVSIAVWVVGVMVLWELAAFFLANVIQDPMAEKKLPYLHEVVILFGQHWQSILKEAGITFTRAAYGFFFGAVIGFLLSVLMSLSKFVEKTAMPYLIMSQMIPILGLGPIIFSLVKDLNTARTVIAAYMTFFPVSVNTLSGFKSVDEDKRTLMYSYAAKKPQLYAKLMFPFTLPYLFTGLKIAAPMAVTASILVDTLSAKDGIGYKIVYSLYGGGTTGEFWPALITGAMMGVVSYAIMATAERILVPWRKDAE